MDGYCCCFQGFLAACFCFRVCVKEAFENVGGFFIHDLGVYNLLVFHCKRVLVFSVDDQASLCLLFPSFVVVVVSHEQEPHCSLCKTLYLFLFLLCFFVAIEVCQTSLTLF